MSSEVTQRVMAHPAYEQFKSRSNRIRLVCFLLMAVVYFGFMLILAFWSGFLSSPVAPDATLTVGVVVGFLVEFFAILLVGIYVFVCNRAVDPLLAQIERDVQ